MSSDPTPQTYGTGWFDAEDAPGHRDLNTCIHCGLCLTACPTYRELKIEPDSPRGRIYLMRGLAEGRVSPTPELVQHLDNCLDCRACETVCPAGVPYGRMLEQTRGQLARRTGGGGAVRWLGEWALRSLIPHRERMQFAADLMRLGQSGPIAAFMRSPLAARVLPAFARQGWAMTPPIEPRSRRSLEALTGRLPAGASLTREPDGTLVFKPAHAPRTRVAFFTSCVMDVMFPEVTRESIRLLVLGGAEVAVPRDQGCCGALQAHAGLRRESMALSRRNLRAFAAGAEKIVTHSAGCGAALREAGHLLREDSAAADAERFSQRVRDISEVLAELELPAPSAVPPAAQAPARRLRVAYHDPCHLAHAQKVRAAPRELLRRLPGVELLE
ncbi:MAG: (Fe-S)-binding protein, partial [Candidatus Eiseniibacteriota bacterium]